ncbi:MAG: hypothetical protein P8J61_03355 [Gammaproteobacteria bacterium]|jgi:carbon monoxide dehydrogenase subunit G|nr:hypothetical protein [Gammaproteobacteria bacterium]
MKISVDMEIGKPKDLVWAAITDIENWTNMISGIIDLKVLKKPEEGIVGLKWIETRKLFGKVASETMWITDSKDGEYYFTRAENQGTIYVTKMSLEEADGKTLLTMSFSGTSESIFIRFISSIMGFFIKGSMIKMVQKDLDDIKSFMEKTNLST